jgi:pimeloyl-ACP methyl ester carboxylesterase
MSTHPTPHDQRLTGRTRGAAPSCVPRPPSGTSTAADTLAPMAVSATREYHDQQRVTIITESGLHTGPGFVLVHGIGMGHRYWSELADELDKHGRVYALDLPGFGDAPEPAEALDMPASGDLLARLVQHERIARPILIGHSMGTQIVAEALARHPDLFDCAVLIAPTVNADERSLHMQAWRMIQDLMHAKPKVWFVGAVYYVKTGPRWYLKKLRTMLDHHIERVLPRIRANVLVIRGANDRVCPEGWTKRVATIIPHSRYVEVQGRGHETMITAASDVAGYIVRHVSGRL